MVAILSFTFTSCSDDDDNDKEPLTQQELIGSVWKGTNPENHYRYTITFKDEYKVTFRIDTPSGNLYGETDLSYKYNEQTGIAKASYEGEEIIASVTKNAITFVSYGITVTLTRVK